MSADAVSGPDEFDVLSDSISVGAQCPNSSDGSNGVTGWLCVNVYINQGFGSTYYQQTFHNTVTDACGNVLLDTTIYQSVLYYSAGYYTWQKKFHFPDNEPNQCDGTWSLTEALTQQFPDGQILAGSVTSPITVLFDAPANAMLAGQTYGGIPSHASQADPVDSFSGAFNDHLSPDLSMAARGGALQVQRSYSSNVTRVSPFGPGWTFNYDSSVSVDSTSGNVTYHDPSGAVQVFTPNGSGGYTSPPGLSSTLTPIAGGGFALKKWDMTQQTFNSAGQVVSTADRNGQGAAFTYNGSLLATVTGSGRTLTFSWDSTGARITRVDGSDGRNVQFGYDSSLNLTSATDPRGKVTTYGYDSAGHLNSVQDPNGNYPVRLVYDPTSGRVTQQQDANGATTTFSWNAATQTATITDPRGLSTQDLYMNGYLIQQTDAAGNATRYSWDNNGRMIRITTPAGQTTTFQYDSAGNTVEKIAPDLNPTGSTSPQYESYTYDANNNLLSETDFDHNTISYSYDTAGNLLTVTRPNVATGSGAVLTTQNTYNTDGTLATSTDANNAVTHYSYNSFGDQTAVTTPTGRTTTYGYDGAGRLTSTVSPRGNVTGANPATYTTTLTLNANGQITQTAAPAGITTSATYDDAGRQLTATDGRGKTTTTTYDANGHPTSVQGPDPAIGPQKYTYDGDGNILTDTSPAGVVTTYTYNSINKKATAQTTGAGQYKYTYDNDGRMLTEVFPSGHTTTYAWTLNGSLSSVSTTDGTTTQATSYSHDLNGNLTNESDANGSTSYSYNAWNQISQVTRGTNTWTYSYDNTGRTVGRTTPGSAAQTLSYDADGRLKSVAAGTSSLVSYAYNDTTGDTVTTLPGGLTQTSSIDAAGRPTKVTGAKGTTVLTQSTYTLDGNGDPTSITDASGTTDTYTYDNSSQLTQVCYATTTCTGSTNYISWTYTGDAERKTETRPTGTTTYTYNTTGQLASKSGASGAATYSYDADGHMTSDGTNTYKWDLNGDLISAGGSKPTTYTYDGQGRRLTTTNGSTTTGTVWDPTTGQLNEETDSSGNPLRVYTYGSGLVGLTEGGASYSYLTDAQGSVRAVVDSTGVAQWTYSYEPFGVTKTATSGSRKAPTNTRQYLGALADGSSYDLTARQYQPALGQYLSPDPAANPGVGYQYGNGNPMSQIDPFGMSGSSWLNVTAGTTDGAVIASPTASYNCTNGAWCSQLSTGIAPMAETAGAVSGTVTDLSSSAASAKGSCPASLVQGSLGGGASGGGLAYASSLGMAGKSAQAGVDWTGIARGVTEAAVTLAVGFALAATVAALCGVTAGLGCLLIGATAGALAAGAGAWIASRDFGDDPDTAARNASLGGLLGAIGGPAIPKELIP